MTPVVLAFSLDLQSRIKTYGAYAGFAAVIGLAVLAVLYFAQAREVKRLREWAGRGPERAAEVGARVGAEAQKRVVAEPIARPEPVTAAAQSASPPSTTPPATPAAQDVAGAVAIPEAVAVAPGDEIPAGDAGAAAANGPVTPAPDTTIPGTAPVAAGAGPGAGPGGGTGDTDDVGVTSVAMAPVPASARLRASATPPPTARRLLADEADEHSPWRARLLIGGAVLVVAIVAVIIATSLGGGTAPKPNKVANTPTPTPVTSTTSTKGASTKHAPPRKSISVGVLNGTTVNGLARAIGQKISGAGFDVSKASEKNARDQTHSATIVAYAAGQASAALEVAKTLNLGRDALAPLDPDTSVVAGQGLTVVVTVGADLTR